MESADDHCDGHAAAGQQRPGRKEGGARPGTGPQHVDEQQRSDQAQCGGTRPYDRSGR